MPVASPYLVHIRPVAVDKIDPSDWTVGTVFSTFTSNEVYTNDAG